MVIRNNPVAHISVQITGLDLDRKAYNSIFVLVILNSLTSVLLIVDLALVG
jgi:hypothetical protein